MLRVHHKEEVVASYKQASFAGGQQSDPSLFTRVVLEDDSVLWFDSGKTKPFKSFISSQLEEQYQKLTQHEINKITSW